MREILRKYVDCNAKGRKNASTYRTFEGILNAEISAYSTGGKVDEFIHGNMIKSHQTKVSERYKEMIDAIKQDRKTYRKNRLLGRLKPQHIYFEEADLYALARNEEEKQFLSKILPNANEEIKSNIYRYIQMKPDYLQTIMRNATNKDCHTIVKIIQTDKSGIYQQAQEMIGQASPKKLKEFARIAGEKTADGQYIYSSAAIAINHPGFNWITKIAGIKIGNNYPYMNLAKELCVLSEKELKVLYKRLQSAAEKGLNKEDSFMIEVCRKARKLSETDKLKIYFNC